MRVPEEWYDHPTDEAVGSELSADFQMAVAWPAMNSLCKIDFINETQLGDAFTIELTRGGYYYKLDMGYIDEDFVALNNEDEDDDGEDEDEDEEGPYIYANLTVSRRRDDLHQELLKSFRLDKIARAAGHKSEPRAEPESVELGQVQVDEEDEEVEEDSSLQSWENRRYHFSPMEEHGIAVTISYELSSDGNTVWSTENPMSWDSLEFNPQVEGVEELFTESLTTKDLALIREGFAALGVNPVFLEWYPPAD